MNTDPRDIERINPREDSSATIVTSTPPVSEDSTEKAGAMGAVVTHEDSAVPEKQKQPKLDGDSDAA